MSRRAEPPFEFTLLVQPEDINADGNSLAELIDEYLAERNPRAELARIRACLAKIREVLDQNFKVSDILIEIDRHTW